MFYISDPSKVNSLLDRISLTVSSEVSGTRLRDQFSLTSDGGKKEEKQVDTETSGEHRAVFLELFSSYLSQSQNLSLVSSRSALKEKKNITKL